jgi:hypothetical protein
MAGHDRKKQARSAKAGRRLLVGMGAGAGVFFAAAAMATGSAAPAKADFDAIIDPIIQPILTSLTDSITAFDPSAAADLTSWSDSFLASLNSLDFAVPSAADPAGAVAASSTGDSVPSGTYDLPITMQEDTEPTVQATVDGASNTLLVDTGSSGLVIPWQSLDSSNPFQALEDLFQLGTPTGISESGYSGGIQYVYLEYDDEPVDYATTAGTLDTTAPLDVEILSWPTSFSPPYDFQEFLQDNDVTGILGIGDNVGPSAEGPLQAGGVTGVTVDLPQNELVVGENAGTPIAGDSTISDTANGAPITSLYETVTMPLNAGTSGTAVSDDVDSGGVYGTVPGSLASNLITGSTITVYSSQGGTELYSYTVGVDSLHNSELPDSVNGTSIDSGVLPFEEEPIYINYADDSLTFDKPLQ